LTTCVKVATLDNGEQSTSEWPDGPQGLDQDDS